MGFCRYFNSFSYGELLSPCLSRLAGALGTVLGLLLYHFLMHSLSGSRQLALQHANAEIATSLNPVRCQNAQMRLAVESILGLLEEE
jgi:hypothetical protein